MADQMVPAKRPELSEADAQALVAQAGVTGPAILGRRGYYRDSMGKPGVNEHGIYDDAIFIVVPGMFRAFNANTDPSKDYPGVAVLRAGVWRYKLGIHNISKPSPPHERYECLVQAAPVTVDRENKGADTGDFGIHIHKGSHNSTSSEGCQTIYPDQWVEFIAQVKVALVSLGLTEIPYVLTER